MKFVSLPPTDQLNSNMNATIDSVYNSNNVTLNQQDGSLANPYIGDNLQILQQNIEGISSRKCEYLTALLNEQKIDVAAIQETHLKEESARSEVTGYTLVAAIHHEKFGLATYVKDDLLPLVEALPPIDSYCSGIKVNGMSIYNVYKPPSASFNNNVFPTFTKPSIVIGDFNSHHAAWGYDDEDTDGKRLFDWMNREDFSLLYNADDPGTFKSARWNRFYTPDLCFVSKDTNGETIPATRKVLQGFPNSQHRPIIIQVGLQLPVIRADKKNRWNFTKANWEEFSRSVDQTIPRIPPVASNYERFIGIITATAKRTIPRGRREAYVPGWNHESQLLYDSFKVTGSTETGKELLASLDKNRKEIWEQKMESLNFAKSSRKAWSLISRLSGKKRKTSKVYPITPDQIASQLVVNSKWIPSQLQT